MHSIVVRLFIVLGVIVSAIVVAAPAAASSATVTYSPPVDAPVSDPFRPPATPYGPGNRGIEYATAAGAPVQAAADGTVVFAGFVAAKQWVTLRHADGVRTTYGPMADVDVASGDTVQRGDVVGHSAGALTFTARIGDAYVDPSTLFTGGPPRVHLIPEPLDAPQLRRALSDGWSVPSSDALLSALDWERRHLETLPGFVYSLTPGPVLADSVVALADWHERQGHCTSPSQPAPVLRERHVGLLVGGLGSSSADAAIAGVDTAALGYRSDDVLRFSYRGGDITATPYDPRDTVGDIGASGQRLADWIVTVAARTSAPIDVIAHSQGGLVARVALAELESSHPEVLERVRTLVTIGTPHHGADLATLVQAVNSLPPGALTLDAIDTVAAMSITPDDVAVQQLAPGSAFLRSLASQPLPAGVHVVSIAGRGDVVVPVPRAALDGATNVVVGVSGPTAHDRLPESPAVTREIALALTGAPPTCESAVDAVVDATAGGLISNVEHALAVTQGAT